MAATERTLLAAALALPGVLPGGAAAQAMPEGGLFAAKYLYYRDWQPGADRMTVKAPSFYLLAPFAQSWTVEGSLTFDAVSGASPLYFNVLSGASGEGIQDFRKAGDVKISKYFDRWIVGAGAVISSEDDYLSRGGVFDLRWFTEDRNTTLAFSFGGARRRHQQHQRRRRGRAPQHRRVPRRHHAGAVADGDHPVEPHLLARARLLQRPVQVVRRPARPAADHCLADPVQPVLPDASTRRSRSATATSTIRSAPIRTWSRRRGCRRCRRASA